MKLSEEEIQCIREKYRQLINYQSEDIDDPIDPLTYVEPAGDNLLHIAAMRGDLRTVELLLKAGLDVNQPGDMGYTALHYAYWKGAKWPAHVHEREDVIRLLLEHGASTTVRNEFGKTPIEHSED